MNREFKFRSWDRKNKVMLYHLAGLHASYCVDDNFVNQQMTEVPDKHGAVIWEGDLIRRGNMVGVVGYFAGMFIVDWPDQSDDALGLMITLNMEVVGNIFENPHIIRTNPCAEVSLPT